MAETRRRTVWYIHGFDPATTARYRRIFAAAAGPGVEISDLPEGEGWRALSGETRSDIRYLRYGDLIRQWRAGPLWRRLRDYAAALAGYVACGAYGRLARRAPRAAALAATPLAIALLPVALAARLIGVEPPLGLLALIAAPVLSVLLLRRFFLDIVADLFAHMRALAIGSADHAERCRAFAEAIAAEPGPIPDVAAAGEETLLVGHSLGGIVAILTLARVLERWPPGRPVHLLTLGSTHGIVLVQRGPGRGRLADAIRRIATDPRVFWVDVSSPRDAFCIPLTDPLSLIEAPVGRSPLVISARLANAPRIPGDRRTVFAAMRRHMGYLLAPEPGSGFDYVETATGGLSLAVRFAERANSPKARMWRG